jgi:hypothetical protein
MSLNQIFRKTFPKEDLIALLDDICIKTEKYYILNNDSYKKGNYTNSIPPFINGCRQYYHVSKQKYVDRKHTYKSFMTIIRQICKLHEIIYTSDIKYDKSKYDIVYHIYY